ncbi:MAG: hypothetical protein ACT4OS_10690 [Acidimicrobiales bacterium]
MRQVLCRRLAAGAALWLLLAALAAGVGTAGADTGMGPMSPPPAADPPPDHDPPDDYEPPDDDDHDDDEPDDDHDDDDEPKAPKLPKPPTAGDFGNPCDFGGCDAPPQVDFLPGGTGSPPPPPRRPASPATPPDPAPEPFVPGGAGPQPAPLCSTAVAPIAAGGPDLTFELGFAQAAGPEACPTASAEAGLPTNSGGGNASSASNQPNVPARSTLMKGAGIVTLAFAGGALLLGAKALALAGGALGAFIYTSARDAPPKRIDEDNVVTRGVKDAMGGVLDQVDTTQQLQKDAGIEFTQQGSDDSKIFDSDGNLKGEGDVGR